MRVGGPVPGVVPSRGCENSFRGLRHYCGTDQTAYEPTASVEPHGFSSVAIVARGFLWLDCFAA